MKYIKTEDAAGHVLCHDITRIIPGRFKGAAFRKGHIVAEEDIPVLLSMGKENLYVWEKKPGILHEDEAALGGDLGAALEQAQGVVLEQGVLLRGAQATLEDFIARDVGVVLADFGLRRRRDDGLGETFVLAHTLGQLHAADFAHAALISPPGTAAKVAAYNHFDGKALAKHAGRHHGVGRGLLPVGADVGRRIEKFGSDLVEHLSLVRDALGQHNVESRDAVGGHHDELLPAYVVNVAHLTVIHTRLTGKMKICLG